MVKQINAYRLDVLSPGHPDHQHRPGKLASGDPVRRADVLELNHLRWDGPNHDSEVEVGHQPVSFVSVQAELIIIFVRME